MKHTKLLSMLALLPVLGGLASCNRKSDDTIYFWHTCGQTVVDELEKRIDEFEKLVLENEGKTINIKLVYQGSYDDILHNISTSFSTGNQPTLAIAYPDHVAEYLASEDTPGQFVVNLADYINDPEIGLGKEAWIGDGESSDFVEAFYEEGSSYGREGIYSLPLMKSTEVMYYNKDEVLPLISKYQPTLDTTAKAEEWLSNLTWDEFMEFCQYIKANYTPGVDKFYPAFYDSDSNMYITASIQKNIPFLDYDDNHNGELLFNNDQAKAMVQQFKDWYDEGLFSTKGVTGQYGSNFFTNVGCLFDIGSSGGAGYNYPAGGTFEVGICKVPAFNEENRLYVTQGLTATVLKSGDDYDGNKALYGYKFLKYLTSTDVNTELCINGSEGYIPVRKSCYETTLFKEYSSDETLMTGQVANIVTKEINGHYFNTPCFKGSAYARDNVGGILSQVFSDERTIDEAFETAINETKTQM